MSDDDDDDDDDDGDGGDDDVVTGLDVKKYMECRNDFEKGVNYLLFKNADFSMPCVRSGCDGENDRTSMRDDDAIERTYKYKIWASPEVLSLVEESTCWDVLFSSRETRRTERHRVVGKIAVKKEKIETHGKEGAQESSQFRRRAIDKAGQYLSAFTIFQPFVQKCREISGSLVVVVEEEKMSKYHQR